MPDKIGVLKRLKKVSYDAADIGNLMMSKEYHKEHFTYIGSGKTIYINGKVWEQEETNHFFIRKSKN